MLVNNITSKAKYQNEKAERLIVKMQKYRKFFFFNEHVYYIKYQQDITTINKKNTTNWHFYSTAKTFLNYRIGRHYFMCIHIYKYKKNPNIHFNLQHDISDPTFCASDPKPPKIKKSFNVFNFQNYYLAH